MNNNVSSVVHNTLKYSGKSVVVAPQTKPIQQQRQQQQQIEIKTLTNFWSDTFHEFSQS